MTISIHQDQGRIEKLLEEDPRQALVLMYDAYAPALYGMIIRIVQSKPLAEDVLQESFLKIWKNSHNYCSEKGSVLSWALQIARRTAIDKMRSAGFQRSRQTDSLNALPEIATTWNEEVVDVKSMVAHLDEKQREVIDLIYFHGFTQREVEKHLGIPLGTVKSRLRLAMKHLRAWFEERPAMLWIPACIAGWGL